MPTLRFKKGRAPIEVSEGANLMQALLKAGLPVASSCRGDGVCAKCRIEIVEGQAHLSPPSDLEKSLCQRLDIPAAERISCQVQVWDDIVIDASYW